MSDGEALLAAILESPADDAPRLVYADWLEERGQSERAWLIRFQCDRNNQSGHDGDREYELIESRIEEWFGLAALSLRKTNRQYKDWYLADYGPPNLKLWAARPRRLTELPIRRGFFQSAECSELWWFRCGPALSRGHPLERVRLRGKAPFQGDGRLCSGFLWLRGLTPDRLGHSFVLPAVLFARLKGFAYHRPAGWIGPQSREAVSYPSEAAACDALSAACLSWARAPEASLVPVG